MSLVPPVVRTDYRYAIHLTVGRQAANVRLEGVVDSAAVADLSRLMDSLELLAYMAVNVDLSAVTAIDKFGVQPLVEASHRRELAQRPPVIIGDCSPEAREFLAFAGLGGRLHVDTPGLDLIAYVPHIEENR